MKSKVASLKSKEKGQSKSKVESRKSQVASQKGRDKGTEKDKGIERQRWKSKGDPSLQGGRSEAKVGG